MKGLRLPPVMTLLNSILGLAVLITLKGLIGVLEGRRYLHYIQNHFSRLPDPWMPYASVILPCKGLEYQLEENICSVLQQSYPFFEVILVTATEDDPSRPLLKKLIHQFPGHKIKLVTAGTSDVRGEKVNNLMSAVNEAEPRSEVLVFTDSDSRPPRDWLRHLLAPLRDERIGLSTGYRWYFPEPGNLAGIFRSAWNASIATLLGNHRHNFAWGGSMAIRRSTFESAKVMQHWSRSLSDDYSMTSAMREANLPIHYEPRCLIASFGKCSWPDLLEWSTRQIVITRFYSRKLWRLACLSQGVFLMTWWGLIASLSVSLGQTMSGHSHPGAGSLKSLFVVGCFLLVIFLLGVVRGSYRMKSIQQIFPGHPEKIQSFWWAYTLLFPLVSTLTGINLLLSAFTHRLRWRGVSYDIQAGGIVMVIRREPSGVTLPPASASCRANLIEEG
ncbi:MAG: glycosyltransferase [Terriglobia bacterium]